MALHPIVKGIMLSLLVLIIGSFLVAAPMLVPEYVETRLIMVFGWLIFLGGLIGIFITPIAYKGGMLGAALNDT